jgi:hypothetical protein
VDYKCRIPRCALAHAKIVVLYGNRYILGQIDTPDASIVRPAATRNWPDFVNGSVETAVARYSLSASRRRVRVAHQSQSDDRPAVPSPPGVGYRAVAGPHRNRLGVVSLILGGVAIATSWLAIGLFFGTAALATGLAARARVKRGEANNRGTAIARTALGAVAIVVGPVALGLVAADQLYFRRHVCTTPPGSPPC